MISKDKKRYSLSLTPENVNTFRSLCKQFKLPESQLSSSVDDFIMEMNRTMQKCVSKGSVTITDLFTMMGESIQASLEEEKNNENVAGTIGETHEKQERKKKTSK
jgi:hypothetical protein